MEEDIRRWVFEQDAQKLIAFGFLEFFRQTYQELLNHIGEYLAKYDKFQSAFLTPQDIMEKEILTKEIKRKLAIIANFLKSVEIKVASQSISEHIKEIANLYDKIIFERELPKEELEKLEYHLSAVIAELFISPVLRGLPTKEDLLYGTHVEYDKIKRFLDRKKKYEE